MKPQLLVDIFATITCISAILLVGCLIFLLFTKCVRFKKPSNFFVYTTCFLVVLFLVTLGLFLGQTNNHASLVHAACLFLITVWATNMRFFPYIQKQYPLEKKTVDWSLFASTVKRYLPGVITVLFFSLGLNFLLYLFIWVHKQLVIYCMHNPVELQTFEAYLYAFNLTYLIGGFIAFAFCGQWLYRKYSSFIGVENLLYTIIDQRGLQRLRLFFRLNPSAKKNGFVVVLALLSFLRFVPAIFPCLAFLSIRLETGSCIAILGWIYLFITYLVTTPYVLKVMRTTYGRQSLKLLGWNGPEANAWKFGAVCFACTVSYQFFNTAKDVNADTLAAVRRGAKAVSGEAAQIVEDNASARVSENRADNELTSQLNALDRRKTLAQRAAETFKAEAEARAWEEKAKTQRMQKVQDLLDGKNKK